MKTTTNPLARMKGQLLSLGLALALPGAAFGHAVSIGYENAGPGSVTIWLGTYFHPPSSHLEGSLNLVGVLGNPFPSTTVPFTLLTPDGVANKPAGLVDGVSNFYADWDGNIPNNLPLVGSEAPFDAGCPACGPVQHWEGVTFSGLAAGKYQFTYVPIANPSEEWSLLSLQMNGIFDLSGVVNSCGYDLQVEVGYTGATSPCDSFGNCAQPDTGFVIVKNNGSQPATGTVSLDGTAGGGGDVHTSGAFNLAPGASVTLFAGPESSNQGGFNKVCGQPDNGLVVSIIGSSAGLPIYFKKFDKDIHSGTARDVHAPPSALSGAPLLSDSYILQGGDPFGGDTTDPFEETQAHAIFDIKGTCGDLCTLVCPGDTTVCNDSGQCSAVVYYAGPNLSGDCTGLTVTCDHASGSAFPLGTTTVTCVATDASNNTVAFCSFNVIVTDPTPLTLTCPGGITQCNDIGVCGATVNYVVTPSDPCPTVQCTPSSGSVFSIGTTPVTCTASDASGRSASCTFNVTVNLCTTKCPLTQGYWKNHASAWPVQQLSLGGKTYTKAQLLTILNTAPGSSNKADASLILADQLIAAKLNLLNGSNPCPIVAAIAAADALIGNRLIPITPKITPNTTVGAQMVNLANTLNSYNNGLMTPGCTP